jgi:hypothetical protein
MVFVQLFSLLCAASISMGSFDLVRNLLGKECSAYRRLGDDAETEPLRAKKKHDLQLYVTKNLVKSGILMSLSLWSCNLIWVTMYHDQWDMSVIYFLGCMYAFTDIVPLFRVPSLPMNTKIHHTAVLCVSSLNLFMDYTTPTVWRSAVIYGGASTTTFLVNLYLGVRLLYPKKSVTARVLCTVALLSYGLSLTTTWLLVVFKVLLPYASNSVSTWAVCLFLMSILYDDIKLITHLWRHKTLDPNHLTEVTGVVLPSPVEGVLRKILLDTVKSPSQQNTTPKTAPQSTPRTTTTIDPPEESVLPKISGRVPTTIGVRKNVKTVVDCMDINLESPRRSPRRHRPPQGYDEDDRSWSPPRRMSSRRHK